MVQAANDLDRARSLGRTDPTEDGPATALLRAHVADRTLRAFERVRDAVADGRYGRPADAGPVRAAKLDALAAFEAARSDPAHPALTNHALTAIDWGFREADEYVRDYSEERAAAAAREATAGYAWTAARARAVPASNRWLAGTLEATASEGI